MIKETIGQMLEEERNKNFIDIGADPVATLANYLRELGGEAYALWSSLSPLGRLQVVGELLRTGEVDMERFRGR